MEQNLFKEKMKTTRQMLAVSGALVGVAQFALYNGDWHEFQFIIIFFTYTGIGVVTIALLRMAYLFAKNKEIMSPVLTANLSQSQTQAPMRLPFKIMLVILFALALLGIGSMFLLPLIY